MAAPSFAPAADRPSGGAGYLHRAADPAIFIMERVRGASSDGFLFSASDVVDACGCSVLPILERARVTGQLDVDFALDPEQELVARERPELR